MTIKFRRKLLAFFILLFIILGAGVILYSQGYRFDFSTFSLTKIGAIYIESYQNPIDIYLNNTYYKDKTGLLNKGTLIASIIPKKYQLTIKKNGYFDYQKNIEILPSEVSRFFNVLLVPTNIASTTTTLATTTNTEVVDDLLPGAILTHQTTSKGTQWFVQTFSLDTTQASSTIATSTAITKELAPISKQKFGGFSFYNNSPSQFIATSSNGSLYYITIQPNTTTTIQKLASSTSITYLIQDGEFTHPINNSISTSTPNTSTTEQISTTSTINTLLEQTNLSSEVTSTIPLITNNRASDITSLHINGNLIAYTTTDKTLFLYNQTKKSEQKIAQNVTMALFSPDAKKLLYQGTDKKIHIYFIENELEVSDAHAGDDIILSLTRISAIRTIAWYQDSNHLLLFYPDQITLAEVTKKEPNNQFPLWNNSYIKANYRADQNTLTISTFSNQINYIDLNLFTK